MTSTLPPVVAAALAADVPVLLWGVPGTGKTAAILAAAADCGATVEILIGATLDPADVGGLPVPDATGNVCLAPPAWARRLRVAVDTKREAWLVCDELSCAPPSVQAALLRVVHDRACGDVDLRGCRVIAAANPVDAAADGGLLSPATANRWAHHQWVCDPIAWVAGEGAGWGQGHAIPAVALARAAITAWIARSPGALLGFPSDSSVAGGAWPSPRSWSHAARLLAALGGPRARHAEEAVASCVGAAAAREWATWLVAADLPDPEEVLAGRVPLPRRGDAASALLTGVVAMALVDRPDRSVRILAAWAILARARPDTAVVAARTLLGGDPSGDVPDEAAELGRRLIAART